MVWGRVFAVDTESVETVAMKKGNKLIKDFVKLHKLVCPCIQITDSGVITVSVPKNVKRLCPRTEDKTIGSESNLNSGALLEWWKEDAKNQVDGSYNHLKNSWFTRQMCKLSNSNSFRLFETITELKGQDLLDKAINQCIQTKWKEQLEKFQEQIEKKRAEVQ